MAEKRKLQGSVDEDGAVLHGSRDKTAVNKGYKNVFTVK